MTTVGQNGRSRQAGGCPDAERVRAIALRRRVAWTAHGGDAAPLDLDSYPVVNQQVAETPQEAPTCLGGELMDFGEFDLPEGFHSPSAAGRRQGRAGATRTARRHAALVELARTDPARFTSETGLPSYVGTPPEQHPAVAVFRAYSAAGFDLAEVRPYSKEPAGAWKNDGAPARIRDAADLRRRLEREPNLNLALILGKAVRGHRLVVADADTQEAVEATRSLAVGWTRTRRGRHVPLRWAGPGRPRTAKGKDGIVGCDLKASGLVMLAPSNVIKVEASDYATDFVVTHAYVEDDEWRKTGYSLAFLPQAPTSMAGQMTMPEARRDDLTLTPGFRSAASGGWEARRAGWLAQGEDGHRHQALASIIFQSIRLGMDRDAVYAEVIEAPVGTKALEKGAGARRWFGQEWDGAVAHLAAHDDAGEHLPLRPSLHDIWRTLAWRRFVRSDLSLTPNQRKILLAHARTALTFGLNYYVSVRQVQEITGINIGTIHRESQRLIGQGWLANWGRPPESPLGTGQADYWSLSIQSIPLLSDGIGDGGTDALSGDPVHPVLGRIPWGWRQQQPVMVSCKNSSRGPRHPNHPSAQRWQEGSRRSCRVPSTRATQGVSRGPPRGEQ